MSQSVSTFSIIDETDRESSAAAFSKAAFLSAGSLNETGEGFSVIILTTND